MADEKTTPVAPSVLKQNLEALTTLDGIQKYLLGTKKNGSPRAVYDIVRDYTKPKKKKKTKKVKPARTSTYAFYLDAQKKKKKKKKGKKKKYWHI